MSDFNPDVEFLGLKVAAGKSLALTEQLPEDDQTEITHRPHITNVALGPNPKPGRHTVFAQGNGMKAVVGTLEMGRCEQFQVDLVARDIVFSHTGKSDVYLTGYNTMSAAAAYFDDMSEEDDDEESEDDEDVPNGVPMQQQQLLPSRVSSAATSVHQTPNRARPMLQRHVCLIHSRKRLFLKICLTPATYTHLTWSFTDVPNLMSLVVTVLPVQRRQLRPCSRLS